MPKSKVQRVKEYLISHPGECPVWSIAKETNMFPTGVVKVCKVEFEGLVKIKYRYQNPPKEVISVEWVGGA